MTDRLHCFTLLFFLLLSCCATARPQSCIAPPAGLVSWWPGDTSENDIVGGNNPTVVNGVTLVPAEVLDGFSFALVGDESSIEIPPASNLENQRVTLAAWAMPEGPGPNDDEFGSIIIAQDTDESNVVLQLGWNATGNNFLFGFGSTSQEFIFSKDAFLPGTFYFVAATYDGTTFKLFVNGALEASRKETKRLAYGNQPWTIGSADSHISSEGYPRTWNGVIDEVQAFKVALPTATIKAIYSAGHAGECKPAS